MGVIPRQKTSLVRIYLKRKYQEMKNIISVTILAALLGGNHAIFKYPWHASCKIEWQFPQSCSTVRGQIVGQINAWEGDSLCPGTSPGCPEFPCGQNCLYSLTSSSDSRVTGTHATPVARYVDDISFKFSENSQGCAVSAKSSSQTWYAVLDKGTNYCNLRNLIDGAGLSAGSGFTEATRDKVCTQYSSRDCSRF